MRSSPTDLRALFGERWFSRLLATRLTSQSADGVFQTSLAGAVVFNPEHHTGPAQVAAGFVILLLPYSLVGPFAGVLLDRWRRRQVLVAGAAIRAVLVAGTAGLLVAYGPTSPGFAVTAMAALAVNRFYLAALSAALPSVVAAERLVLANAISPTSGTVATIAGGGIGLAVRALAGHGDHGNAVVALVAAAGYLVAASVATRLPPDSLGPHPPSPEPLRTQLAGIAGGLADGVRHLRARPVAGRALGVIFAQRLVFGVWSIMGLLLYRNAFHDDGLLRGGLVGVGQAVATAGVGLVTAAAVTPWVTQRLGRRNWIVVATVGAGLAVATLGAPFAMPALLVEAFALGFAFQATKVSVDTLVQREVDDDFRGRGFAFYDTAYNISFVLGALIAAITLPADGRSLGALLAMAAAYLAIAVWYAAAERCAPERRNLDVAASG